MLIAVFSCYKQYFREYSWTATWAHNVFLWIDLSVTFFTNFRSKKRILDFNLHFLNLFRFLVCFFPLIHKDAINVSIDLFLILKLIRLMLSYQLNQTQGSTWFLSLFHLEAKIKTTWRTWEMSPCCCSTDSFLSGTSLCNNEKLPCDF